MQPQTPICGDILFVRGQGIIADVIRFFDPGEFSHIAIALNPTHVLECQRFIDTVIRPNKYVDYEIVRLNLLDVQKTKLVHLAVQMVGFHQYDYLQLLQYVFDDFGWTLKLNSPNKYICSEMVSTILYGINALPSDEWIRDLSPNGLYKYLKQLS